MTRAFMHICQYKILVYPKPCLYADNNQITLFMRESQNDVILKGWLGTIFGFSSYASTMTVHTKRNHVRLCDVTFDPKKSEV